MFCKNILDQIEKGNIIEGQLYTIKDKLLRRYVREGNDTYKTIIIPTLLLLKYFAWHMII